MKTTIVHLSDLHYRPNWPEANGLLISELLKDLALQIKGKYSSYLVFSGDFVQGGANPDQFSSFISVFDKPLTDIGLPHSVRVVVPGNHDISQISLRPSLLIQKGALSEIKTEDQFNDTLPQLAESVLSAKFRNYSSFEHSLASYTCCNSNLGGSGWKIQDSVGVYCLNTALCSFGGLPYSEGKPIDDLRHLMVDTRSLCQWLLEDKSTFRILVMHHPLDWLAEWSKNELSKIISQSFQLVLCGHVHAALPQYHTRGFGGTVSVTAPPLFTRKSDLLGYSLITLDSDTQDIDITYRQWAQTNNFVTGTSLSGTDNGTVCFRLSGTPEQRTYQNEPRPSVSSQATDTLAALTSELHEASLFYSSKPDLWIDRDLARTSELQNAGASDNVITQSEFVATLSSCVIRAPSQFGLSCLGRKLALEYYLNCNASKCLIFLDTEKTEDNEAALVKYIEVRCNDLCISRLQIAGVIVDNWQPSKSGRRILRNLRNLYPTNLLIVLHNVDDCARIAETFSESGDDVTHSLPSYFLWSLTRNRVRQLVDLYVGDISRLDDEAVTKRVITDIDTLNIHRTPLNCLLLLKLAEQAFDESPVNRTEVISRVLYLLFFQFDKIPTYATRPDIKDCEYALGFFSEWLIREHRVSFLKKDFYAKIRDYCEAQLIELDVDVLFAFLVEENVLVKRGGDFAFRFSYWLYYFAAHRMHHSQDFASFMLTSKRYSSYPELLEFYTGIDRRRTDAVSQLTTDLREMSDDFIKRTGIHADFNPLKDIQWRLTQEGFETLQRDIKGEISTSSAPASIKDAIADSNYNRSKPYYQDLANFINESSLGQMIPAMRGASRALRNSDHVSPAEKAALLREVVTCWKRVCQTLVILSPILAKSKKATFEGISFYLDKSFDPIDTLDKTWHALLAAIVLNVVDWYQEDIFSKKMGPLFINHIKETPGTLDEILLLLVLIRQRPGGWEREAERFIIRESKNSFYLNRVFSYLSNEFKYGTTTERSSHDLRKLAAMAIAKHQTGATNPNARLVELAARQVIDEKVDTDINKGQGRSKFF